MKYYLTKNEKVITYGHFKKSYLDFFVISLLLTIVTNLVLKIFLLTFSIQELPYKEYFIFNILLVIYFYLNFKTKITNQEIVLTNKRIFVITNQRIIILYDRVDKVTIKEEFIFSSLIITVGKYNVRLLNLENEKEIQKTITKIKKVL